MTATYLPVKTEFSTYQVRIPQIPGDVGDVPAKYLRRVARAMGVSPTVNRGGKRVYKSMGQLRSDMCDFLWSQVAAAGSTEAESLSSPVEEPVVSLEPVAEVEAVNTITPEPQQEDCIEKVTQDPGTLIVEPDVVQKPLKAETKLAQVAEAMIQGATKEDLKAIVSNPQMYFTWELKAKGLGTKQIGDWFFLVFPQGQTELIYK